MPTVSGWNLDLHALPGWDATQWWELFELPNADLAFIAYDIGEIGMNQDAGYLAVYERKSDPMLAFHPASWMVIPSKHAVLCDQAGDFLLVYLANVRDGRETGRLIDLRRRQFARISVSNELYGCRFMRVGDVQFENTTPFALQRGDNVYAVDATTLRMSPFVQRDGVDIMTETGDTDRGGM